MRDREKQKESRQKWEIANKEYRKQYKKDYAKKHYAANREFVKAQSLQYRNNNLDKCRNSRMKRVFGISLEEYNDLFQKQNGICAICMQNETKFDSRIGKTVMLAVDHNHETGEVRGLLCSNCNLGLGKFKDNIAALKNAIKYLEK